MTSPAPLGAATVHQPDLSDGTLRLRPYRPEDIEAIVSMSRDQDVRRWARVPEPYGPEQAEEFLVDTAAQWRAGTCYSVAVLEHGRFAGGMSVRPSGRGRAELGYGLLPQARGRGVMTRAGRLLLPWAHETLGLATIGWLAAVGNWPSRRVAWALGFRVEGTSRALVSGADGPIPAWFGSRTAEDPYQPPGPWWTAPELTDGVVRLRPLTAADAGRIVQACQDPDSRRWLTLPDPYRDQDALDFLLRTQALAADGEAVHWALCAPRDPQLLGAISAFRLADPRAVQAEIGYWTHPAARRRGLTARAVRLVARHALVPVQDGGLGRGRVVICVAAGNLASRRVALAAGFRPAGVDRSGMRLSGGELVDLHRFDLLEHDLTAASPSVGQDPPGGGRA